MVKKAASRDLPAQPQPVCPYEPSANDLVADLLALVLQMAPGFTAAMAEQVEKKARDKWGGDKVYIQRRGGMKSHRNDCIRRDYQAGERIELLERRYQLKASRLWEIIQSG